MSRRHNAAETNQQLSLNWMHIPLDKLFRCALRSNSNSSRRSRPFRQTRSNASPSEFARVEIVGLLDDDRFCLPFTQRNRTIQELARTDLVEWQSRSYDYFGGRNSKP
jgi:hypothetical protein